jgi:hypothetical protein
MESRHEDTGGKLNPSLLGVGDDNNFGFLKARVYQSNGVILDFG